MAEEYEVKLKDLTPYLQAAIKLAYRFKKFHIDHLPWHENVYADAFASLATTLMLPTGSSKHVIIRDRDLFCPKIVLEVDELH